MSVDTRQLELFAKMLARRAHTDINDIRREIIRKEAQSAVSRAKLICKNEKIVDTGNLRNSFHAEQPTVSGGTASCVVANNADYASYVEYGHLTGVGRGGVETLLRRRRRAVGKARYVRGKYVLTRAMQETFRTQQPRIEKRLRRMYEDMRR